MVAVLIMIWLLFGIIGSFMYVYHMYKNFNEVTLSDIVISIIIMFFGIATFLAGVISLGLDKLCELDTKKSKLTLLFDKLTKKND